MMKRNKEPMYTAEDIEYAKKTAAADAEYKFARDVLRAFNLEDEFRVPFSIRVSGLVGLYYDDTRRDFVKAVRTMVAAKNDEEAAKRAAAALAADRKAIHSAVAKAAKR